MCSLSAETSLFRLVGGVAKQNPAKHRPWCVGAPVLLCLISSRSNYYHFWIMPTFRAARGRTTEAVENSSKNRKIKPTRRGFVRERGKITANHIISQANKLRLSWFFSHCVCTWVAVCFLQHHDCFRSGRIFGEQPVICAEGPTNSAKGLRLKFSLIILW